MSKSTINRNYNSIDLMKLLMAIFVVSIHTEPLNFLESEVVNKYFKIIVGYAVPFFFVTSGFFLYNKIVGLSLEMRLNHIKNWCKRTFKLYVVWTLIYLPYTIYGFYLDDTTLLRNLYVFTRNFFLVGENFLSWPLWYLLAILQAGLLIYLMEKYKLSYGTQLCIGILLTIIGYMLDLFNSPNVSESWWAPVVSWYFRIFQYTRNGLFQGLLYMLLGIGIVRHKPSISCRISILLFLISCIFWMLGLFIAKYISCLFLFMCTISYNLDGDYNFFKKLRLLSVIIYFTHMIIVGGLLLSLGENIHSFLFFLIVLFLVLILAFVLLKQQEKSWFKFCFN